MAQTALDRVQWLNISMAGEYATYRIKVDLNFPDALSVEMNTRDNARFMAALSKIVLDQEGWPVDSMDTLWKTVSQTEILLILKTIRVGKRKRTNLLMEFAPD